METIDQLTLSQLETLIEDIVERKIVKLLGNPDEGLELKPSIKAKLRRSMDAVKRGERGIPAKEVAKELGLKW